MSKRTKDLSRLPGWPLLLDADAAARFLGLAPQEFARAVRRGEVPPPARVLGRERWSRLALEAAFDEPGAPPVPAHDPILAAIDAALV